MRIRTVPALVAAGLALAGCGSHTPTKADVVARADAICSDAFHAVQQVPPPAGGSNPSPAALAAYLRRVTPIVEDEAQKLGGLPRPAQDRALLVRYLAAVHQAARGYRTLERAARRGDAGGVARARAALQTSPAPQLAARYGLKACAGSAGAGD